jgi:hypothetical protein
LPFPLPIFNPRVFLIYRFLVFIYLFTLFFLRRLLFLQEPPVLNLHVHLLQPIKDQFLELNSKMSCLLFIHSLKRSKTCVDGSIIYAASVRPSFIRRSCHHSRVLTYLQLNWS